MAETMVNWGVEHVFGMVGHSNLGLADALRRQEEAGKLTYIGIRHEGAAAFAASAYGKLTGRPAACLTIAGPGRHQPAHRAVGREGRPRAGARAHRPGRHAGARPGRVPGGRPARPRSARSPPGARPVLRDSNPVELMNLACKNALLRRDVAHLIFPDEVQTLPAPEGAAAGGPDGPRVAARRSRRPRSRSTTRCELLARREAAGDHRRPRRALPHARR